jgi:hypothetical protein
MNKLKQNVMGFVISALIVVGGVYAMWHIYGWRP